MQAFSHEKGIVLPIDRPNVDTDAIIPKQFLKSIKRSGFGPNLFDEWRYQDVGQPDADCRGRPLNPDCVLNQAAYQGASILLARDNFGCGSSREHAVWALTDFGIRVVIAPSFADIFFSNCGKNGLLAIRLAPELVNQLFDSVTSAPGISFEVDLQRQVIELPGGQSHAFEVDAALKQRLLQGLDDIAMTLQHADAIREYEESAASTRPWMFQSG